MGSLSVKAEKRHSAPGSGAMTLIEVLFVLALIALLVALALPAINAAREASRRMACASKLRQIGLSLHTYLENDNCFPRGSLILRGGADGLGGPWDVLVQLLPHLEADELYNALNLSLRNRNHANRTVASMSVSIYLCPSDLQPTSFGYMGLGSASYHKCLGSGRYQGGDDVPIRSTRQFDGVFAPGLVKPAQIIDGLSHTATMAEMVHGGELLSLGVAPDGRALAGVTCVFNSQPPTQENVIASCNDTSVRNTVSTPRPSGKPWVDLLGYTHLFTPGRPSCFDGGVGDVFSPITASSRHANGGINLLFADGHVAFISSTVNQAVWQAIGSRNGQEQVSVSF